MKIEVQFDKAIVEQFMHALATGLPLDPGGQWTGNKVLMAAAVLRYASEHAVNWQDNRPESEHREHAEARGERDVNRVGTVIKHLTSICFLVREGTYSETYPDNCTLAIDADRADL